MDVFNFTRQNIVFPNENTNCKFYIQDDLLYDCVGLGKGNCNDPKRVTGFNSGKAFGYALLTYFTTRALNIQRFPLCEDRIYASYFGSNESHADILCQLDEKRIESICNEVKDLYQHTQRHLQKNSLPTVYIGRKIKNLKDGYVETIIKIKRAAELLGQTSLEVEMDTLNSFGDEGAYRGEVFLKMKIPASDIFYCSNLIADRPGKSKTVESGEWIVLNRSPTGVATVPLSEIHIDDSLWQDDRPLTVNDAKNILKKYKPFVLRRFHRLEQNYGTYGLHHSLKGKILSRLCKYMDK
ncbi:hypothetical protein [Pectobacterium versatile]|uniref:hypothetical protein n=1 Tax=Pectobacterium versatile TaxID=2488639 RepID=UPI001934F6FD|nr:hypothetical protein [Pectobacterium versatile]QQK73773.1 hypothetical protein HG702_22010 [Pectobacterium versatile]